MFRDVTRASACSWCVVYQGVKIDRDSHGNIYLTKLADCEVIVKGFRDPQSHCIADDVVETSGRVGSGRTKVVSHLYMAVRRSG